jgi:Domain of unknown function (DUF3291)
VSAGWHVAQVNIALPREPLDSPALAEFVANLEPANALADGAPGSVWRLADETGDATSIRAFDDERLIINMSAWESIEALWEFVYSGRHLEVMRRRREWMTRIVQSFLALWWVRAGTLPTIADARLRLDHLRAHGPTPYAFTFKRRFPPLASGTEPRPTPRPAGAAATQPS